MVRIARVVIPAVPHHITQRGNRRQKVFFQDSDYQEYISLMSERCGRFQIEIWAYCLMPNHVHLIAVPHSEKDFQSGVSLLSEHLKKKPAEPSLPKSPAHSGKMELCKMSPEPPEPPNPRTTRMIGRLQATAIALIILFGISGCGKKDGLRKVRLWALAPPEVIRLHEEGVVPLRFAVALLISPCEGFKMYGGLVEHLGKKLNRPVQLILRRNISEVNDLVRNRQVEAAFLPSHGYIRGRKDFGLESLAVSRVRGRISYSSYIIVPIESEIETPQQLGGRVFAFANPLPGPNQRTLLPREWERPEVFFKRCIAIYGHDKAIKAVAEGFVDGALVNGVVYEQMTLGHPEQIAKVKVIRRSTPYGTPVIVVHPQIGYQLKKELQSVFLTMHQDKENGILQMLAVDRFVPPDGGIDPSIGQKAGGQ